MKRRWGTWLLILGAIGWSSPRRRGSLPAALDSGGP